MIVHSDASEYHGAGLMATPLATSCSASAPLEQNLSRHGRTQGFVAGSNSIDLEVPI